MYKTKCHFFSTGGGPKQHVHQTFEDAVHDEESGERLEMGDTSGISWRHDWSSVPVFQYQRYSYYHQSERREKSCEWYIDSEWKRK